MLSLESSSWASLPMELLLLILDGLMEYSNYLRFSLVCRSWFFAAICQKEHRIKECQKQVPMLLAPTEDRSHERRSLYNITQNKVIYFQVSVPYSRRCCGSCCGWLATADKDLAITLLNPFSGKTIKFPPVTQYLQDMEYPFEYEFEVYKVAFSDNPSLVPNDFVLVAIYNIFGKLAYIKPGQKSWTYIGDEFKPYLDVIFHKGKIYACDPSGRVISFDINGCKLKVTMVAPSTPITACRVYIVESSHGDLLVVYRTLKEIDHSTQLLTTSFKITKLVGANEEGRCTKRVEIDSLGEDALFLGDNYSMSILASNFTGCQANCIYYTDDFIDMVHEFPLGFRDLGIYYLKDASIGSHYKLNNNHKCMPPSIWIVPTPVI